MQPETQSILKSPITQLHEELDAYLEKKKAEAADPDEIAHLRELFFHTEDALALHDSLLTTVFESSPYISVIVDSAGRVQDINRAGLQFAGHDKEELLNLLGGEVFGCITSFEGAGCGLNEACTSCPIRSRVSHTFETKEHIFSAEGQMTFLRGDEELDRNLLVSTSLINVLNEDMVLVTLVDITDQKNTEDRLAEANAHLQERIRQNEELQLKLRQQAIQDPLTGLYNRRYLHETFPREMARAMREQTGVSVIMIDLDRFKRLNDQFGHLAGDSVLTSLGALLIENLRVGDVPCRYGGEEFLLLLPGATLEFARTRAEEIRKCIEEYVFSYEGQPLTVTISAGVACAPQHGKTLTTLVSRADAALYEAKAEGRNKVVSCDEILRVEMVP